MSMSMNVVGFRPPDEKWKLMKAVYEACNKAGISIPKDVIDFFNGVPPDPQGVSIRLEDNHFFKYGAVKEWREDGREGFEVDITKLPKDVTIVRFYNSW